MSELNMYLLQILQKYGAKDLVSHELELTNLRTTLVTWASSCYINILYSGSRAKGTAIALASDVDYLIALSSDCNDNSGGLKGIYDSLFSKLSGLYVARKQNVSVRINLRGLEVDVTPAKKQAGTENYYSLYVSKSNTWKQTNTKKHIDDISQSGRTNEIKLLKIWRELHGLDFPSIYLEYLLVNNILWGKSKDTSSLGDNFWHVLKELAKSSDNPLGARIVDPANSNNVLSDLLTNDEKILIINIAQLSIKQNSWGQIVW